MGGVAFDAGDSGQVSGRRLTRLIRSPSLGRERDKLRPDSLPVVREHLAASYQSTGCGLDRGTVNHRDRTCAVCPAADVRRMGAYSLS